MGWYGINLFLRGDLFGKSLVDNPRGDISQEKIISSNLLEDVSPKGKKSFWEISPKDTACVLKMPFATYA